MGLKLFSDEDPLQAIKKAILQHEDTFRHQVLELHRLYWIQKNLMNSFSCNELGNYGDPFAWRSMPVPEKSSFWSQNLLPPEHSSGFFSKLYQDRQRSFDLQFPAHEYGFHQVNGHTQEKSLVCNEAVIDLTLELTLGVVDHNNMGKKDVTNIFSYRNGYLNRPEVIDLDDSMEAVGNEEGAAATSFGPKTPTIFSEARHEYKQPRLCIVNISKKTRKYLDCGQADDPIIAGPNAINGINPGNHFAAKQHCSTNTAALFDLNKAQTEELAIPVHELEDISTEMGSSVNLGNSKRESSIGKTSVTVMADTLYSSSTNYMIMSVSAPGNLVAGSQQSSNGSSPLSPLNSCSPIRKNGYFPVEQPLSDNVAICSAINFEGSDTQPSIGVESEIACERREENTISSGMLVNQELHYGIPCSNEDPPELPSPFQFEEKSRKSNLGNLCNVGYEDESEDSIFTIDKDGNASCLDSHVTDNSSNSEKANVGDGGALRWSEEVDRMILMASTSLVHMSLENSIFSSFVYAEVEEENSEQPCHSIDSLEHIVLTLPENREMECSSPFKPAEEPISNSKSRYSSRSGRQLRNFQKDILPGIVALSRHEICEDMHAFTEIVRSDELRKKGVSANVCRGNRYTVGRNRRSRRR